MAYESAELDAAIKSLEASIDRRLAEDMAEILMMRGQLRLIRACALSHIDGDSQPNDTHWSEIVGIAEADRNWLDHARANYEIKHERLVELSKRILESVSDETVDPELAARMMADQIEEAVLPEMVLGENGRTFQRAQAAK